jgi:predicted outer membrane repeat protein
MAIPIALVARYVGRGGTTIRGSFRGDAAGISSLALPLVKGLRVGHELRRRVIAISLVAPAIVLGVGTAVVPASAASRCVVRNATTGTVYSGGGGKLQAAISAAPYRSKLLVRGRCVGNYHVHKALTLIGLTSTDSPMPTLDGRGHGIVLTVRGMGRVEVRNLRITGGAGEGGDFDDPRGGGISNKARLILSGRTRVSENSAEFGAGIWSRGFLELRGRAEVVRNHARGQGGGVGGGIYSAGGVTRLRDNSVVHANTASLNGGGAFHFRGRLVLRNNASITGNVAHNFGGGVYVESKMTLKGSATVTGNTASAGGGGLYADGFSVRVCSASVTLSPNDPDDPPKTKSCS